MQGVQSVKRFTNCPDDFRRSARTREEPGEEHTSLRIHHEKEKPYDCAEDIVIAMGEIS